MGSGSSQLAFGGRPPTVILLAGLQGSAKTTAAAKLALLLRKEKHVPGLIAADLQRPAAIDQLEQLGKQIQIPVYREDTTDPVVATRKGIERAREDVLDVVVVDTAGRLHVDQELMDELVAVRNEAKPTNVLLVLDAMTGQEAVAVAEAFLERVAFDGVVLTKLDGDARGGAALSVKAVTGKPIKLASVGEKLDQLEYFHPDRMASRILGMGDVMALIARVEAIVLSMTPQERKLPRLIDGRRRLRIARGSGTTVQQVNQLLEARKQMEKMMKGMSKGKMPALPGLEAAGGPAANGPGLTARPGSSSRKKKRKSRSRR